MSRITHIGVRGSTRPGTHCGGAGAAQQTHQRLCRGQFGLPTPSRRCIDSVFHRTRAMVQRTATRCNTLQYAAAHYNTLENTATHCNALQRTATHCNALQRTAMHCSILYQSKVSGFDARRRLAVTLAIHCNTLQSTAAHFRTLAHCNTKDR